MEEEAKTNATERLIQNLKSWQPVILKVEPWLQWQKEDYPWILSGGVTTLFVLYWWFSPPVISAFAAVTMLVCVADYMVPRVSQWGLLKPQEMGELENARFGEICRTLVEIYFSLSGCYSWIKSQRVANPKRFFIGSVTVLLFIGFIGNAIPNILLVYLIVLFLVLLPGLNHKGILLQIKIEVLRQFVEMMNRIRANRLITRRIED